MGAIYYARGMLYFLWSSQLLVFSCQMKMSRPRVGWHNFRCYVKKP
jgi:hypothetical protein